MHRRVLDWYHEYLCHPGGNRLAQTLKQVCHWQGMTSQSLDYCKKCSVCQKFKKRSKRYGHVPPKNVSDETEPWSNIHIDLVGPYTIEAKQEQPGQKIVEVELQLLAMTMIDPTTGWFEIVQVPYNDQGSARISQLFNNTWIARYPRPAKVVYDHGSEFKRHFRNLLLDYDVKASPTTAKNPQANAMVERIHLVIQNMLRTKDLNNHIYDYHDPFGEILSSVAWAVRSSYHTIKQATPAQLVFGRDMIMPIVYSANWKSLTDRRQKQIDKDNKRENSKRIPHDYNIGDRVYIIKDGINRKMTAPQVGPFPITQIYANGTVRIQRGVVNERINIRRLTPHFE
jgi:hypothetical protein